MMDGISNLELYAFSLPESKTVLSAWVLSILV